MCCSFALFACFFLFCRVSVFLSLGLFVYCERSLCLYVSLPLSIYLLCVFSPCLCSLALAFPLLFCFLSYIYIYIYMCVCMCVYNSDDLHTALSCHSASRSFTHSHAVPVSLGLARSRSLNYALTRWFALWLMWFE
jgi:hypothetical protein